MVDTYTVSILSFSHIHNDEFLLMIKTVYFQREAWGDVCIQFKGDLYHFSNLVSLVAFCQAEYGDLFELVEVTDDNYQELLQSGAFDDQ